VKLRFGQLLLLHVIGVVQDLRVFAALADQLDEGADESPDRATVARQDGLVLKNSWDLKTSG